MKAMVYHGNRDLRLEDVQDPSPGPGEVVLRIDYCGICATDIEEYVYGPKFMAAETPNPISGKMLPLITGHEITGTVVEIGEGVENVDVGQRSVLHTVLSCNACWWCRRGETNQCASQAVAGFHVDGGLAEYIVWPAREVVPLPEHVTSKQAALVEPGAVAHHAVQRGAVGPGDKVAVLGAGTVGLLAMQIAKSKGAAVYALDRRQMSLDMAERLGADAAINAEAIEPALALGDLTDGVGPDVVIDAAGGADTPRQAVEWVRSGGRVVLVAIYTSTPQFDFNSVVMIDKSLVGSAGYTRTDVEESVRLVGSGALQSEPLITDIIGLDQVVDVGFARMMAPEKDVFRILVAPSGEIPHPNPSPPMEKGQP